MDASIPDNHPANERQNKRRYGGVLPEERQRVRRARLIEGGLDVFGTKGFHGATHTSPSATSTNPSKPCLSSSWRCTPNWPSS
jgi:hypothetical protein